LIKIKGVAANQHGRISHRTITMTLSTKKGSRFNFLPNKHANFHHPPSPPPKKKNSYKQTTLISPQKVPAANNKKKQQHQQNTSPNDMSFG